MELAAPSWSTSGVAASGTCLRRSAMRQGRFDPIGAHARGACYWAEDPLGAWVKVFRTVMTIVEDDLARYALSVLTIDEPIEVADLSDRRGLAAGATAAVGAGTSRDTA